MSESMVERVARAIYEHSHEPSMRWEDSAHQPAWCLAARYAIAAMREPTKGMLDAVDPRKELMMGCGYSWQAMCDAALR